jgi:hypothetical protein
MSRESSLWSSLSKVRGIYGPAQIQIERVENLVAFGMPDVDGFLNSPDGIGAFTLELKAEERPSKAETLVRFKVRDSQIEWNGKRWSLGGRAFYLCQVGSGSRRSLYLLPGDRGLLLRKGLPEAELRKLAKSEGGVFTGPRFQVPLMKRMFEVRP